MPCTLNACLFYHHTHGLSAIPLTYTSLSRLCTLFQCLFFSCASLRDVERMKRDLLVQSSREKMKHLLTQLYQTTTIYGQLHLSQSSKMTKIINYLSALKLSLIAFNVCLFSVSAQPITFLKVSINSIVDV